MTEDSDVVQHADDPMVKRIQALLAERQRDRNEILIENEANIGAALDAGFALHQLFVSPAASNSDFVRSVVPGGAATVVADEVLDQLFERTRVPAVFAVIARPPRRHFRVFDGRPGDIVVLDALDGPGNIGSVIRVAAAFEAAGIVALNQHPADLYRRGIVRASAGTMFRLPLVTTSTQAFLRFCQASGTRIVTTSSHAPGGFFEVVESPHRLALVFGSETQGCSPDLEAAAQLRCRIPMNPEVESLNVSAAASVVLFARSPFGRPPASAPRPGTQAQG